MPRPPPLRQRRPLRPPSEAAPGGEAEGRGSRNHKCYKSILQIDLSHLCKLIITYFDYNLVVFYGLSKLNNNNILIKILAKIIIYSIPNLSQADLYISSSNSIPIKSLFISLHATPILPLPIVGSNTTSFSLL